MKNENLNKENFFDNLFKEFPDATQQFCDWIDAYKKEVGMDHWYRDDPDKEGEIKSIKFHDLPFEMQKGIIHRFAREKFGTDMVNFNMQGLMNGFTRLMTTFQEHINEKRG